MKLSKKLFRLLFCFSFIIIIIFSTTIMIVNNSTISKQFKKNLDNTIVQNGELIDTLLYRIAELLIYPSFNITLYNMISADTSSFSSSEVYKFKSTLSLIFTENTYVPLREYFLTSSYQFAIYDKYVSSQLFINDTRDIVTESTVKDEEWMNTKDYSITVTNSKSNPNVAQFSRIVYYREDQIRTDLGVLVISIDMTKFIENMNNQIVSNKNLFYLISPNNTIYKIYGEDNIDASDEQLLTISYDIKQHTLHNAKIGNLNYFMSAIKLNQGWQLVGYTAQSQVYTNMFPIFIALIITAFILLIFSYVFSHYYAPKKICTPINKLIKTIETKDYSLVDMEHSFKEMEILSETYNSLATHTTELIDKIISEGEKAKTAEIKALQAQINPHFLYNTLDSINWKIMKYEDEVPNIINDLSTILRYSISKSGKLVTLSEEIAIVKSFIEIEEFCYSFKAELHIESSQEFNLIYIPKLTLQPLVENAILHGILEQDDPTGKITISSHCDNDTFYIYVKNTGKTIDIEATNNLLNEPETNEQHGIRNINTRIKMLHGKEYGLSYSIDENGETVATIKLPL